VGVWEGVPVGVTEADLVDVGVLEEVGDGVGVFEGEPKRLTDIY
jgi:hypothetical protein